MKKTLCCCLVILFIAVTAAAQNRYDVVISEIMADPSPPVGLPNSEWIELKNTSSANINLQGWRIADATGSSGPMPSYVLKPDSSVTICSSGSLAALQTFGACFSVTSFPSLDNDGELLTLRSAAGKTIHAVDYKPGWYKNDLKKEGGWSLEMIDPHNACNGMINWKASVSPLGGSPGRKNSVDSVNVDRNPPQILKAYLIDERTIIVCFMEGLDSLAAANTRDYTVDRGIMISSVKALSPLFDKVELRLANELQRRTVYTITASGVPDCSGNVLNSGNTRVGVPEDPMNGEWIINEILFNPVSNGSDYVEFYNNSNKIFDARKLYIANRSSGGMAGSVRALAETPTYIYPGEYPVVTDDSLFILRNYKVERPDLLFQVSSMPSFPDDEGTVVTLKDQGIIAEEVHYREDWHFRLLANDEGVALERMDPSTVSNDSLNWHSASSSCGYGTPTGQNSQYRKSADPVNSFQMEPIIFSPDNDGYNDVANINYEMQEPGYMANIRIYDSDGLPVRYLVRNNLLGYQGHFQWDGLDDNGQRLPIGNYIAITEIFNLSGKTRLYKNLVVLARKLR